jgi:sugar phosphate isomerase/epimerase
VELGLSSYTFPWAVGVPGFPPRESLSAFGLIDLAAGAGIGLVQLADNLPLQEWDDRAIDELAAHAAASGVRIELATRGIGPHLNRYVELASRFGAPFVRVVIDHGTDEPDPDEAAVRLREFAATFRASGVTLAIENHDRFTVAELAGLVRRLGDWVGICLDTVNSLGSLETPEVVVDALAPLSVALHLKDFLIRRHPHQMGFEVIGAPAGEGMLDIPAIVAACAAYSVRTAVLELWTPPAVDVEQTIVIERSWAERSLEYLREVPELTFGTAEQSPGAAS